MKALTSEEWLSELEMLREMLRNERTRANLLAIALAEANEKLVWHGEKRVETLKPIN